VAQKHLRHSTVERPLHRVLPIPERGTQVRNRITPALVVSVIAVVLAVAGSATAASLITGKQIKNGSITSPDLKNGSVKSADLKDGTIRARDLRMGAVTMNRLSPDVRAALAKAGVPGANGKDGANGKNGKDGADGRDGVDGQGRRAGTGRPAGRNWPDRRDGSARAAGSGRHVRRAARGLRVHERLGAPREHRRAVRSLR
jgi:hypothetical protein